MNNEDDIVILPEEGGKIEYKVQLTEKREFVKEIVAFANSGGGTIHLGISDNREIKGISKLNGESINKIGRDNCVPPIILDVTTRNIHGKNTIIVEIPAGKHPPYRTDSGRYMIRDGKNVRDASVEELIDLIVKGPHKGTILLRANLDDLESSILASIQSGDDGTPDAIQGIAKLIILITNQSGEKASLNAISSLKSISKHATGFHDKITSTIIKKLPLLPSYLIYDNVEKPSQDVVNKIIDILEEIFGTITIVPKEIDLIRDCLTSFYHIAMCCNFGGYVTEKQRIYKIIEQKTEWHKIDKHCKKALTMIDELPSFAYMPQRLGYFIQRV